MRKLGNPVEVIEQDAAQRTSPARRVASPFVRWEPGRRRPANGLKAALIAELATLGTSTPVMWFKADVYRDRWLGRLVGRRAAWVISRAWPSSSLWAGRAATTPRCSPARCLIRRSTRLPRGGRARGVPSRGRGRRRAGGTARPVQRSRRPHRRGAGRPRSCTGHEVPARRRRGSYPHRSACRATATDRGAQGRACIPAYGLSVGCA